LDKPTSFIGSLTGFFTGGDDDDDDDEDDNDDDDTSKSTRWSTPPVVNDKNKVSRTAVPKPSAKKPTKLNKPDHDPFFSKTGNTLGSSPKKPKPVKDPWISNTGITSNTSSKKPVKLKVVDNDWFKNSGINSSKRKVRGSETVGNEKNRDRKEVATGNSVVSVISGETSEPKSTMKSKPIGAKKPNKVEVDDFDSREDSSPK